MAFWILCYLKRWGFCCYVDYVPRSGIGWKEEGRRDRDTYLVCYRWRDDRWCEESINFYWIGRPKMRWYVGYGNSRSSHVISQSGAKLVYCFSKISIRLPDARSITWRLRQYLLIDACYNVLIEFISPAVCSATYFSFVLMSITEAQWSLTSLVPLSIQTNTLTRTPGSDVVVSFRLLHLSSLKAYNDE